MLEVEQLRKHGAVTIFLQEKYSEIMQKLEKQCEISAQKLSQAEEKMQKSENEIEINKCFLEAEALREELLKCLIQKSAIEKLLLRQAERLAAIKDKIDLEEENGSAKKYIKELSESQEEVSVNGLGLSESKNQLISYKSQLLLIKNGELDLSSQDNCEALKTLSFEELGELIYHYPTFVKNITEKILLSSKFRINLLKAVASYVFEEQKSKTLIEINNNMGQLLNFDYNIVSTFADYIDSVINLFKVKIKSYLQSKNPEQSEIISKKLICDESSNLLPKELIKKSADSNSTDSGSAGEDVDIDAEINAFLSNLVN